MGCQAQVLRIANILYSGGRCPAAVFVFVLIYRWEWVEKGGQLSRAAETWEDCVNVCVGACRGAPFPNLTETGFLLGCFLVSPREAFHRETSFGIIKFVTLPTPSQFLTEQLQVAGFKNMGRIWQCSFNTELQFKSSCLAKTYSAAASYSTSWWEKPLGCATRTYFTSTSSPEHLVLLFKLVLRFGSPLSWCPFCAVLLWVFRPLFWLSGLLGLNLLFKNLFPKVISGLEGDSLLVLCLFYRTCPLWCHKWICVLQWVEWLHVSL